MGILSGMDIERINEKAIAPLENNLDLKFKEKLNSTIGTDKEKPLNKLLGVVNSNGKTLYPITARDTSLIQTGIISGVNTSRVLLVDESCIYIVPANKRHILRYNKYTCELILKSDEIFEAEDIWNCNLIDESYIYVCTVTSKKVLRIDKETLTVVATTATLPFRPDIGSLQDNQYVYGLSASTPTQCTRIDKQTMSFTTFNTVVGLDSRVNAIDSSYIYYGSGKKIRKMTTKSLQLVQESADISSTSAWTNIVEYGDYLYASEWADTGNATKIVKISKETLTKVSQTDGVYSHTDLLGVDKSYLYTTLYNTTYFTKRPTIVSLDSLATVGSFNAEQSGFNVPKLSNQLVVFSTSADTKVLLAPSVVKGYIEM